MYLVALCLIVEVKLPHAFFSILLCELLSTKEGSGFLHVPKAI